MENDMDLYRKRLDVEKAEDWFTVLDNMPVIHFPSHWAIKLSPPFGGAMVRFRVIFKDKEVSVYFDTLDRLGIMGEPYWEIYPAVDGDIARFPAEDVEELIWAIQESLDDLPVLVKVIRYFMKLYLGFKKALKGRS